VLNSLSALYEQYSGSMVGEGEALDELVLVFNADAQGDLLRRIGTARRTLSFLRSHIRAKRDILSVLTTKDIPLVTKDTKVYLRDVLDKYNRMEESLLLTKDTLNNLHATYLARISIEVAEASNKVNEIMKTFGAVATIFIPLGLVAGIWGMNVKVPGEEIDNYNWFIGIVLFMIAFAVTIFYFFLRKGLF